jgi:hypothetical protein
MKENFSLDQKPPTDEERQIIHDLYLTKKSMKAPKFPIYKVNPDVINEDQLFVPMSEASFQSVVIMQPQERNIYNKVPIISSKFELTIFFL